MRAVDLPRLAGQLAGALRPWFGLALVCAGFSLHPDFRQTFWTRAYLPNLLQQAATNIILATGMTFVILTGGIDLSVGAVLALCGVTLGLTCRTGPPLFLALAMAFPAGVLAAVALSWPARVGRERLPGRAFGPRRRSRNRRRRAVGSPRPPVGCGRPSWLGP